MYSLAITSSLFLHIIIATTEGKPATDSMEMFGIQACGKELADLLASTCPHGYHSVTKLPISTTPAYEDFNEEKENNLSREKRNIRKRSIIQECCIKPCKWHDLLAYCFNGSSLNVATHIDWDKLKAMGVKLIRIDDPPTFTPYPAESNVDITALLKNNELLAVAHTKINDNELPSNIMDVGAITPNIAPTTSEKTEHITSNGAELNGHVKSITPYHSHKTTIYVDNRPLNPLNKQSRA